MKTLIKIAELNGFKVELIGTNSFHIYLNQFEFKNGMRFEKKIYVYKNAVCYFINNKGGYTLNEAKKILSEMLQLKL